MGLTLKSFQQVLTGMVDWVTTNTTKLTDFSIGSAIRTLLEGISSEVEQAYFNMYKNVNWGIENAIFQSFGFTQNPAITAGGIVTLTFTNPLVVPLFIPAGTQFSTLPTPSTPSVYFQTTQDYTVAAGSTNADLNVACTQAGVIGNVGTGTVTIMTNPMTIIQSVTNNLPFSNGAEAETLAQRQQRFNNYIQTLQRGTIAALKYGCLEVDGITGAYIDDSNVGAVYAYCHDSNGNLSTSLQSQVQANLDNYRSAGIPVYVLPIVKNTVFVNLTVTVGGNYNNSAYQQSIVTAVTNYLNSIDVGQNLYVADLYQLVMNLDTVGIVNCHVDLPLADVIAGANEIIRPTSVLVTLQSN